MNWTWLAEMPTTNGRIAVTLALVVLTAGVVLVRLGGGYSMPDGFEAWLFFLAGMSGIDAVQFIGKRKTAALPPMTDSGTVTGESIVPESLRVASAPPTTMDGLTMTGPARSLTMAHPNPERRDPVTGIEATP